MIKFILYFLSFYFLYRFIFHFLLPVSVASKQIRKNMEKIKKEQEMFAKNQANQTMHQNIQKQPNFNKKNEADFIEYEEIK